MNTERELVKRGYSHLLESVTRIGAAVDQRIDSILDALADIEIANSDLTFLPPELRRQHLEEIAGSAELSIHELLLLRASIRRAKGTVEGSDKKQ